MSNDSAAATVAAIPDATPTKLRSGAWGATVIGVVEVGDQIRITARSGKSWLSIVERVYWTGNGRTIVASTREAATTEPSHTPAQLPATKPTKPTRKRASRRATAAPESASEPANDRPMLVSCWCGDDACRGCIEADRPTVAPDDAPLGADDDPIARMLARADAQRDRLARGL